MRDFRKIKAWEKAHEITLLIYKVSANFPDCEKYGLTAQIRRACASIPTNIAEGCGRNSTMELGRFMDIAFGSASEVEYQLLLAHDLQYISSQIYDDLSEQIIEVKRMLSAFISKLKSDR